LTLLAGITCSAAGDTLNTAGQALLFAVLVCLALILGVLIAGMRETADRIKEEVEGR
jgi:hypothetical protein